MMKKQGIGRGFTVFNKTAAAGVLLAAFALQPGALAAGAPGDGEARLLVGWGTADITPGTPVVMSGGRRARISTGIMDPIGVTALVLESVGANGETGNLVAQVSIDLSSLREDILHFIAQEVAERIPRIDPDRLILYATHTHAAPDSRPAHDLAGKLAEMGIEVPADWTWWGVDLGLRPTPREYARFVAGRVTDALEQALENRAPGGVGFGLGHAVIGHNRLTAYFDGSSRMYGPTGRADFSHLEGYEDHAVDLLYTFDAAGELTGVVLNAACPAQVSEGGTLLSADFWHETRLELRRRLGGSLHVLPQVAAAGDQAPLVPVHTRAEERMQRLMFPELEAGRRSPARRQQIAVRISEAVTSVLPLVKDQIDWNPVLFQLSEQVELTRLRVPGEELERIREDFEKLLAEYLSLRREIEENPGLKQKPGWSDRITTAFWNLRRSWRVLGPHEREETTLAVPVHVVRVGEIVMATNPFELYLDYGMRIKARSPAVQTFVVQLANGAHGYLPTERSVAGGAYGAVPESNEISPGGGRELVEKTLKMIEQSFGLEAELGLALAEKWRLPADGWRFRIDPEGTGRAAGWFAPGLDDGGWRADVTIEDSWQNHLETPYHGAAWYRLAFRADEPAGWKRAFLRFEGVDEQAWAWVNGQFAGKHALGPRGWNKPFDIEVTGLLEPGQANHIAVMVENTVGAGGIWRPVTLLFFR